MPASGLGQAPAAVPVSPVASAAMPQPGASPALQASKDASSSSPAPAGKLEDLLAPSVADYVRRMGGTRAISRILIANNGIAAVKAIRSMRRFAYLTFGDSNVLQFIAMATPEDIKANAAYIHLADEFVQVPGGTNNHNYANVALIAEIAERCNAHAVWAGWGHASENPKLPELLSQTRSNTVWIGPPPHAMRALGDKIGSTLIAQSAGVPCIPWSGSGISVKYTREAGIPEHLYLSACVSTPEEAAAKAEAIGYPLMVKASEGGGGKGIRAARSPEQVRDALRQVQGEVPGSPVFLMRLSSKCRHLEVQLLADVWGDAIAVHGRDCSVQRRHQKIMEEAPVTAASRELFREMEQSAVRLAKEVGYVGAGTVEYLYIEEERKYYFLELNPRLQVEHPVTERITEMNLPAAQLQIAMGIPLHRIEGIRKLFGQDPALDTAIDFERTLPVEPTRHCIACRITAEDPDAKFQPTSGVIRELNFRSTPHVWGYFSVSSGSGIHEFSDSQFGHLFASGRTREEARLNMILALSELSIRGDIRTTVEYLGKVLEVPDFRLNKITTTWLEEMIEQGKIQTDQPEPALAVLLGAAFSGYQESTDKLKDYMATLSRGQFPSSSLHAQLICSSVSLIYEDVKYIVDVTKSGPDSFDLSINGSSVSCDVHSLADDGLLVLLDGKKHVVYGQEFPSGLRLTVDGKTCVFREEYDPTKLKSAVQGKLVRYLVPDGSHVEANTPYAEVEVMKMYISLRTSEAGVLHQVMQEGRIIEQGSLLAEMTLDEPDRVRNAELFTGRFRAMRGPNHVGQGPHHRLREALNKLTKLLDGYQLGAGVLDALVADMMTSLRDPGLPLARFHEILSTQQGRLPAGLYDRLCQLAENYEAVVKEHRFYWETPAAFPVMEIQHAIDSFTLLLGSAAEQTALRNALAACGLTQLIEEFRGGNHAHAVSVISSLFQKYLDVEALFDEHTGGADQMISELRKLNRDNLDHVANIARAHHQLKQRNLLVKALLQTLETQLRPVMTDFLPVLRRLGALKGQEFAGVVLKCRQLIMRMELPDDGQRSIHVLTILRTAAESRSDQERQAILTPLIEFPQPIEDLLISVVSQSPERLEPGSGAGIGGLLKGGALGSAGSPLRAAAGSAQTRAAGVQAAAMEVYIRRVYQAYAVPQMSLRWRPDQLVSRFYFTLGSGRKRSDSVDGGDAEASSTPSHRGALGKGSSAEQLGYNVSLAILNREGKLLQSSGTPKPAAATTAAAAAAVVSASPAAAAALAAAVAASPTAAAALASLELAGPQKRSPAQLRRIDSLGSVVQLSFEEEARARAAAAAAASVLSPAGQFRPQMDYSATERLRLGVMGFFEGFEAAKQNFPALLQEFEHRPDFSDPGDVLYVGWRWAGAAQEDGVLLQYCDTLLRTHLPSLSELGVRRVTFLILGERETQLSLFTFRHRLGWQEDPAVRHIEPCNASHMHLARLRPFHITNVSTTNRAVHVFEAVPRSMGDSAVLKQVNMIARSCGIPNYEGRRFFVRSLMRRIDSPSRYSPQFDYRKLDLDAHPETEFAFVEALNALEMVVGDKIRLYRYNSIFVNVLVESVMSVRYIHTVIRLLAKRYSSKINRLNVTHVEFIIPLRQPPLELLRQQQQRQQQQQPQTQQQTQTQEAVAVAEESEQQPSALEPAVAPGASSDGEETPAVYHFLCSNPTGFVLHVDVYREAWDAALQCPVYHHVDLDGNRVRVANARCRLPGAPSSSSVSTASSAASSSAPEAPISPEPAKVNSNSNSKATGLLTRSGFAAAEAQGECREGRGGLLDGLPLDTPYALFFPLQRQRMAAQALGTIYAYDWVEVVHKALEIQWRRALQLQREARRAGRAGPKLQRPRSLLQAQEYVLDPAAPENQPRLVPVSRPPGQNDVGMIFWLLTLRTPEYPEGREVVLIVNDITFEHGTFGVREDLLFCLASQMARHRRIPRLYFAANSGARIGLADQVRDLFRVAFVNDDPLAGVEGLYLTEADHARFADHVQSSRVVTPAGEVRFMLRDVLGRPGSDIGVENLRGSGLIAGETSLAYKEVFTLTFVTGRSVGIGAYLARLGQRCIQKHDRPLLLTGYDALNKLLGRPVYTSNVQLGGTEIMYHNGVSHRVVNTDLEGVVESLDWLAYVPKARGQPLPLSPVLADPVDRRVEFAPESDKPYDPRFLLEGRLLPRAAAEPAPEPAPEPEHAAEEPEEEAKAGPAQELLQAWESGLFDRGSWMEVLSGWAQTVVCGRARLGGIPVGVVTVETRAVESALPADPANPESKEQVVQKAGQVWFPDSAYKTAQAIEDLMAEDLPLFVLANWRGFSGGMQDMYDEILKYGSYIVDRLRDFDQPAFVYIPPLGTLRGGAWVVLDSSINQRCMEMYADSSCRAGILEPAGTVGVKFRKNRVVEAMRRLDPELKQLLRELEVASRQLEARRAELEKISAEVCLAEPASSSAASPSPPAASSAALVAAASAVSSSGASSVAVSSGVSPQAEEPVDPRVRELEAKRAQLQQAIGRRQQTLLPVYHQIATVFVDLHDTPGRMLQQQTIHGVVDWASARGFFYWRLRRRLVEQALIRDILSVGELDADLVPEGAADDAERRSSGINQARALADSAWHACRDGDARFEQWLRARALVHSWVAESLRGERLRASQKAAGAEHKRQARRDSVDFESGLPLEAAQAQVILCDDRRFVEWHAERGDFLRAQVDRVKRISLANGLLRLCADIPSQASEAPEAGKPGAESGVSLSGVLMELLGRMSPEQTAAVRLALSQSP